ncbi:MAG TPA: iron-sulfur cluster-binding protein [Clostridiales bacterium]|nr:iron-sulfur cluster-binding protein [Clostridiales bacterium]
MPKSEVVVLKTGPGTVVSDYGRLLERAGFFSGGRRGVEPSSELLVKLNLSWTRYFPACSTAPWQLDGVLTALRAHGFPPERIVPVENKTVVTDPVRGSRLNGWEPVLRRHGVTFRPLTGERWVAFKPKARLLVLDRIFPEGIEIPELFIGRPVLHLPTLKTHGHSVTTGAVKNAFGGLLKEVRHFCHAHIHETLVDLMLIQREIHPAVWAVMDGTVCGDGAGPRTMVPVVKNLILASSDSVALDAVAAKLMGFNPLEIPYLRLCHEMGLGVADPLRIEVRGEDISGLDFGFRSRRSLVIWADQLIRKGFLRGVEPLLLRSPLSFWAPLASALYHDYFWLPLIGSCRIRRFMRTEWGGLAREYLGWS